MFLKFLRSYFEPEKNDVITIGMVQYIGGDNGLKGQKCDDVSGMPSLMRDGLFSAGKLAGLPAGFWGNVLNVLSFDIEVLEPFVNTLIQFRWFAGWVLREGYIGNTSTSLPCSIQLAIYCAERPAIMESFMFGYLEINASKEPMACVPNQCSVALQIYREQTQFIKRICHDSMVLGAHVTCYIPWGPHPRAESHFLFGKGTHSLRKCSGSQIWGWSINVHMSKSESSWISQYVDSETFDSSRNQFPMS